jgi:ATP-dependent DNA helicase RecG
MSDGLISQILAIPEETHTTEFKLLGKGGDSVSRIVKGIVAMANADGGLMILGVDDPEKTQLSGLDRIYGVDDHKDTMDEIGRETVRIAPVLAGVWEPRYVLAQEVGKTVAILEIPKAENALRSIDDRVWIRQNKSIRILNPQEMVKLSYAKGIVRADRELVDVDFSLLETGTYHAWRRSRGVTGDNIQDILKKTGLARAEEEVLFPTRAAVLLFAEYPSDLMDTKCAIKVMQFPGTTELFRDAPNMLGKPKILTGSVNELIVKAHDFVLTSLRTGLRVPAAF